MYRKRKFPPTTETSGETILLLALMCAGLGFTVAFDTDDSEPWEDMAGSSVQESSKELMSYKIEAVTPPVTLGEGPHWDHAAQALYFVSIFDYSIHKYVPATGEHTSAKLESMPTFIIPVEGKPDHFVVSQGRRVVELHWAGGDVTLLRDIAEVDAENPLNRFNDAKADPRGRLFAGTMGHEYRPGKFYLKKGSLYNIGSEKVDRLEEGLDISNGLCWDEAEKAFYFADSFEYVVRRYDYDIDTGAISNKTVVFDYKDHGLEGIVDGMTIDANGNLWIANFDGYQVIQVDPRSGSLLQRVPLPAKQVTSCTWGGPNLDELYVTTASMNRGEPQLPPCGSTFRITGLGTRGYPNAKVRL